MIILNSAAITNGGLVREKNQDNYYLNGVYKDDLQRFDEIATDLEPRKFFLCAVFDGMGGEANGEWASLTAAHILSEYQDCDFSGKADEYISKANAAICQGIVDNNGLRTGSTLAILYIKDGKGYVFNIGDSRVYRIRKEQIETLSYDHTEAMRLVRLGLLPKEQMNSHPGKHRLTQHLGIFEDEMQLEVHKSKKFSVKEDDVFVLCSDGLTDMLTDEEILQTVCETDGELDIAKALIKKALDNGGSDNVTVVVVKAGNSRHM